MIGHKRNLPLIAAFLLLSLGADVHGDVAPKRPASKPIAFTYHDRLAQLELFYRKSLVESYKSVGVQNPKWDAAAIQFLEAAALQQAASDVPAFYRREENPAAAAAVALGKAALDAGCTDPLVRSRYVLCAIAPAGPAAAGGKATPALVAMASEAGQALGKSKYPDYIVAVTLDGLRHLLGDDESARLEDVATERYILAACEKPQPGDRRNVLAGAWDRMSTRTRQKRFIGALEKHPDANPWVLANLQGRLETRLAWDSRGSGWGNQVTADGWKGFSEHLSKARDAFRKAQTIDPSLPQQAADMITVAMGGGEALDEKAAQWFESALEAQVDFLSAYDTMLYSLTPRWGGSYDQMLELGVACVTRPRYDTLMPWQYVATVDSICRDMGKPWVLLEKPDVYEMVVRVADGYAAHFGPSPRGNYYKTLHAAVAARTEKWDEARKTLDELTAAKGSPDLAAFAFLGDRNGKLRVSQVYALTGPNQKALMQAIEFAEGKKFPSAYRILTQTLSATKEDDPGRLFVSGACEALRFPAGEWAMLPLIQDKWKGGRLYSAALQVPGDKGVSLIARGDGTIGKGWFWSSEDRKPDVGRSFEISTDILFQEKDRQSATGGLGVCEMLNWETAFAYVDFGKQKAGFVVGKEAPKLWDCKVALNCQARMRFQDGKLTLFVDDKQVGEPYELGAAFKDEIQFGFGGPDESKVHFANVRVRRYLDAEAADAPKAP